MRQRSLRVLSCRRRSNGEVSNVGMSKHSWGRGDVGSDNESEVKPARGRNSRD